MLLAGACHGDNSRDGTLPPGTRNEYRIGADDVIEVLVWKEPGLSTTVPVRPDGRITVPLAGEVDAEGRTPVELAREIGLKLASTVLSPTVTVAVKEIRSAQVYVFGEVARPGAYPLRGGLTLVQALAVAGGLTEFADQDGIVILRRESDGKAMRLRGNLRGTLRGGSPLYLQPGDTVVVP